ncbi:MAG: hypothetical protein K0S27_1704 [Gammaproteobacteria bacterium]|jgi:hypothetical protein|nr:hypothetical protein [Gammaproteobacteria bacterium]
MKLLFFFYKNKHEWINKFYNQLKITLKNKKIFLIISISFLFLFIFLPIMSYKSMKMADLVSLQNKRNKIILHELNDINSLLHDVRNNPLNSKQQQMAFQSLEKDIVFAQKSLVDAAKTSDIQKISGQIASVKDDIDSQMNDMKKIISEDRSSKQFLNASVLPFHVISVDVIASQPYISVEYNNHILPLAIGDSLTGWRVISADYELGMAEFENEQNQYIKVSLQGA